MRHRNSVPVRLLEDAQTTFRSTVYHKEVDIRHFRKHRRLVTVPKVELAPAAHIFNDKVTAFQPDDGASFRFNDCRGMASLTANKIRTANIIVCS